MQRQEHSDDLVQVHAQLAQVSPRPTSKAASRYVSAKCESWLKEANFESNAFEDDPENFR